MRIIVCIKQVPATREVEIDPESGTLLRQEVGNKTNVHDLYAIEKALCFRDVSGGTVTAITMGPPQAEEVLRDAYAMGVDECVLLCDRKFAGADVLATSYTLSQGIRLLGGFDLIFCGKQTTDGDTAQVGPALAEHLSIPHIAWIRDIDKLSGSIRVTHDLSRTTQVSQASLPCLVTVDSGCCVPRLPSYHLLKDVANCPIRVIAHSDLPDNGMTRYGLIGSPTTVRQTFSPAVTGKRQMLEGDKAAEIFNILEKRRFTTQVTGK